MTSQEQPALAQRIARYVLRPLFVFLTFTLVLMAIFQAGGRFSMAILHVFEDELNAVLETQDISVAGLRGGWRGLNPQVFVESVVFPAGQIARLDVELDVLESMFRSAWVPHTLMIAGAEVHLEQTAEGWQLRGMGGPPPDVDVEGLLRHGDHLEGRVDVLFHPLEGAPDRLQAELKLINRDQIHFAQVGLRSAADLEHQLNLEFWQTQTVLAQGSLTAQLSGTLTLPRAFTGSSEFRFDIKQGLWSEQMGSGGGSLEIDLAGPAMAGQSDSLTASIELTGARKDQQMRFGSAPILLRVGEDELQIGPLYGQGVFPDDHASTLAAAAQLINPVKPQPLVQLWLEQLDLAEMSNFVVNHFGGFERVTSWLKALDLQGQANNLHLFYEQELGVGYGVSVAQLSVQGHRGVPTLTNAQARIWGYAQGHAIQVSGDDVYLRFPGLYQEGWDLASVQGIVKLWFGAGYLGVQGTHIRTRLGDTQVAGSFAITRPEAVDEQRLSLLIFADETSVQQAKTFVPSNIPPALEDWLEGGLQAGRLSNVQYAYHGQLKVAPGELARRNELTADISGVRVRYEPSWPEVYDVHGQVHVAGTDVRVIVDRGASESLLIRGANMTLFDNATYAAGTIDATGDATDVLGFVRNSPLQNNLAFITPAWQGAGRVDMAMQLVVPVNVDKAPQLSIDLDFELGQVDLAMPEYRMVLRKLQGPGKFSLPHDLTGNFSGQIFGQPAIFKASHTPDWLTFDVAGTATPKDIYQLLDTDLAFPLTGVFNFDSVLKLPMSTGVIELSMRSDLQGLAVGLPAEFAKTAEQTEPVELDLQFLAEYQSVSLRYKTVDGWFHYGDGIERGALGIDAPPPMTSQEQRAIAIAGRMPQLVLSQWVSPTGEPAVALPMDWTIISLRVDKFVIDELVFTDLVLTGGQQDQAVSFKFDAPALRGTLLLPAAGVLDLDLDLLQIPQTPTVHADHIGVPQVDPISIAVGESLPAAKVNIKQLLLGDEPFGNWQFEIQPQEDNSVRFESFSVSVNGVHIENGELSWDLSADRSSFEGLLKLDDLAETLPLWDYAPSLSTTEVNVNAAGVTWPGSPLNVSLLSTDGEFDFLARDGRFVEVEAGSGGLRILALLNFTKVAKRISLDFSDVVGQGMSFERIDAKVALRSGVLTFPERLTVESSSVQFQVGGQVDMRSGQLNNEMIVTLPVSKSLPWYGLYLSLANPVLGATVLLGERVLRKPMEQFSTAKYEVTGTLDDPEVKFVSIWDRSMKEPLAPAKIEEPARQAQLPNE